MKKKLALLLFMAMVLSSLAGCGGSTSATPAESTETVEDSEDKTDEEMDAAEAAEKEADAAETPEAPDQSADETETEPAEVDTAEADNAEAKEAEAGSTQDQDAKEKEAPSPEKEKDGPEKADVEPAEGNEEQKDAASDGSAEEMLSISIGKVSYYYANTAGDDEDAVYQASVRTKKETNVFEFSKSDLTQLDNTDYYYTVMEGVAPLEGTLYGYTGGTEKTYSDIYSELGVSADETYDAISSATGFSSHHAGDIPSVVAFGTDADGNKVITGIKTDRESATVEADTYVAASILNAEGQELSDEQKAALEVTLKAEPMSEPSASAITPLPGEATYVMDGNALEYGLCQFVIHPDDTVEGYVWNEYLDSIYAATISDGTTTAGAVHWIDIYGEPDSDPEGRHYNKIQISLNNGTAPAKNEAEVNRYAAFFNEDNTLKAGTYTICIYAEGYEPLESTVVVE